MSAYIVENKTINKVLTYLKLNREGDWINSQIKKELNIDVEDVKELDRMGRAMLLLNIEAVDSRYSETNDSTELLNAYNWQIELNTNIMQALKSLQCWLYQCSEGKIPESGLYKLMDEVKVSWLEKIVSSLPAYNKIAWS